MLTQKLSISNGNNKMGCIKSVSLPPVITCVNCASCSKKCYALKLTKIYPSVKKAYDNNLEILKQDRKFYFDSIKATAILEKFFRYHVSGDIIDMDYLDNMCKTAISCKGTKFLAFTKNYDVVNNYLDNHKSPANLKLIFSLPFDGAKIDNRHNLPTAHVILKGQDVNPKYKICGGNCAECASCGIGCWGLKKGETIAFHEH